MLGGPGAAPSRLRKYPAHLPPSGGFGLLDPSD